MKPTTKKQTPEKEPTEAEKIERLKMLQRDVMFAAELVDLVIQHATTGTAEQRKAARALIASADAGVKVRLHSEFVRRICGG